MFDYEFYQDEEGNEPVKDLRIARDRMRNDQKKKETGDG